MPSIANQDFKIYGLLNPNNGDGVKGMYCGELHAAILTARKSKSITKLLQIIDSFVIDSDNGFTRMVTVDTYYDDPNGDMTSVNNNHFVDGYYEAIWAIQQAVYAFGGTILASDTEFGVTPDGIFGEMGTGDYFVNEDGYLIKGTSADGKLASLYLGEKAENPAGYAVVRLESLLPLVGELPLDTTEIW